MKTFVQLKGGEHINLAHVVRYEEQAERIVLFLSDGSQKVIPDGAGRNRFENEMRDHIIITY